MMARESARGSPVGLPVGALRWPQMQRLIQRWLRRWGFALTGWVLGSGGLMFIQSQVSDDYSQALQAVEHLQQQVAGLAVSLPQMRSAPVDANAQRMLDSLPGAARQGPVWVGLQPTLSAHGLRLLSLKPILASATVPVADPVADPVAALGKVVPEPLSSQAVAVRVQGRFTDWSRAWTALTQVGPLCVIDQISITATDQAAHVQIDAVLRLWLQPGQSEGAWSVLSDAPLPADHLAKRSAGPLDGVLFVQNQATDELAKPASVEAEGSSRALAAAEVLPKEPQHWPLARLRLLGLWQQGPDRQAILSAGPHWAKVSLGQRVTLEGHRVALISDEGLSLQLAQGPLIEMFWPPKTAKVKK